MKVQGKEIRLDLSDSIKLNDSIEVKAFSGKIKRFIVHIVSGWFPSIRKDLSPEGVQKVRIIDRKDNRYQEKVTDVKTGRILRDVEEKLSDHH
ncbi:MAG TPA: hypothetical protein ACFYEK_17445 [Candidatus Wunengus sp. YC60]|uniref:hypothetical protein n=1 Tax=Candidatus Wunengus sp. YC60 TaxID=3367697 RepID=UPI004027685C